jgi:hypothetical protein
VHIANVLEQETAVVPGPASHPQWDREYLAGLGLENRIPVWEEKAGGRKKF